MVQFVENFQLTDNFTGKLIFGTLSHYKLIIIIIRIFVVEKTPLRLYNVTILKLPTSNILSKDKHMKKRKKDQTISFSRETFIDNL